MHRREQNSIYYHTLVLYQDATQYCGPLTGVILNLSNKQQKKKPTTRVIIIKNVLIMWQ